MAYLGISFKPTAFKKDIDLPAIAEACFRWTPDLFVRADGTGFFLDVSRCLGLYSVESLGARLQVLFASWSIGPADYRIASGRSLPEAWVRARWEPSNPPIDCIRDWIDPLGERFEEERVFRALTEMLFRLGLRRESELAKLPADSAVSRFGEMYRTLILNLDPTTVGVWERFRPREALVERFEYPPTDEVESLEPLLFTLKEVLDRMGKRLFGRGLALTALRLVLECEPRRQVLENWMELDLTLSFPQTNSLSLLKILREKLSREFQRRELLSPIRAVEVRVTGTAPRSNVQRNFLDQREEEIEKWKTFLTELGTKLSPEEYFLAELTPRFRPEESYRRVMKDPERVKDFALPYPERPLTLFTPPEPLHRVGRFLIWGEHRYTIERFSHFERVSGEWWEGDRGYSRAYFRVHTREGALLWIYRERGGGLFIHGVYRWGEPSKVESNGKEKKKLKRGAKLLGTSFPGREP